ncbi:MAG: DsbC family protein [Desulfuromonadaceae bacterium]|nr:DsbC family protein [Desulfuromonadaceae bacterium]
MSVKKRINRYSVLISGLAVMIATAGLSLANDNNSDKVKENLIKTFPNLKNVGDIRESPLKGLYEVSAGDQVFYFSPDGYLMFGEIWSKEGKNLTAAIKEESLAKKIKDLPLEKAMKIGNGPKTVIEFTDPDCPYCRKVDKFLSERTDITRYVYFFPLRQSHPDAEKKSRYILSQVDKSKALNDVVAGTFDGKSIPVKDGDYELQLKEMELVGSSIGVRGTPVLWINGTHVNGADLKKIGALLTKEVAAQ